MFGRLFQMSAGRQLSSKTTELSGYSRKLKPVFDTIAHHFESGESFRKMAPPKMVEAFHAYEKAAKISDDLLYKKLESLSHQDKDFLAKFYSKYAVTLDQHYPHKVGILKDTAKKALQLDPTNEVASKIDTSYSY